MGKVDLIWWVQGIIQNFIERLQINHISRERLQLKGLFTKQILPFKSHILNSNGVWYSRFGPMWRRKSKPLGTKLKPIFCSLGRLQTLPTKISYTTLHYYSKYEISTIDKCLVNNPFKGVNRKERTPELPHAGVNLFQGLTGFDMVGARNNSKFQREIAIKSHLNRKIAIKGINRISGELA